MIYLARSADFETFFWPTLFVMVGIAILIGGIAIMRKYVMTQEEPDNDPMAGFNIGSLRDLVKQGKMTQEEYDAAKNQIASNAQRFTEKRKPVTNPAPEKKLGKEDPI